MRKAIYGLKQAAKVWNDEIHQTMINTGFKRSKDESCLYYNRTEKTLIICALYIDDIIIFFNNTEEKDRVKKALFEKYKMKDLGKLSHCLGLKIDQDGQKITVSQTHLIEDILKRFGMADCRPFSRPMDPKKN